MNNISPLVSLRFRPDEITVPVDEPFKNDKLGREPFVSATTELLKAIQEPFVIALNAPWGSGKSTTFKLLENKLQADEIVTVSFNAWEVDYATDPLVPLVSTMHERLLEIKGYGQTLTIDKIERFKKLGGAIVKHGAIAAMKVATAGFLDGAAITDELSKATEKVSEDLTGDVIDAFKREKNAAQKFRELLTEITSHVRVRTEDGKTPPPVVLLIDELDRCRPTFAVAMLERIKHFFSVPGLVFVLAIDIEQLKSSTRKVYGLEMDAIEYLRRFIDLELSLPRSDISKMAEGMLTNCGADEFFAARINYPQMREDRNWIVSVLKELANNFDLSPRTVQRIISRLMLVLRQTPSNYYLDPILVVFMIFLRMRDENSLRGLVSGRLSARSVMESVSNIKPRGQDFCESHVGKLVEGHLLYSQKSGPGQQHTNDFIKKFNELTPDDISGGDLRIRDIYSYYSRVNSTYFSRGGIDLRTIEARINLISSDIDYI